jgi:hypothetical protein
MEQNKIESIVTDIMKIPFKTMVFFMFKLACAYFLVRAVIQLCLWFILKFWFFLQNLWDSLYYGIIGIFVK